MSMFVPVDSINFDTTEVKVTTQTYEDRYIGAVTFGGNLRIQVKQRDTPHGVLDELQELAEKMLWAIACERNALDLASNTPLPVEYR